MEGKIQITPLMWCNLKRLSFQTGTNGKLTFGTFRDPFALRRSRAESARGSQIPTWIEKLNVKINFYLSAAQKALLTLCTANLQGKQIGYLFILFGYL